MRLIKSGVTGLGILMAVLLVGCEYEGTQRGVAGHDYAHDVFSVSDMSSGAPAGEPTLHFPLDVAVAEIGELAPRSAVLKTLRDRSELFGRVEGIPGLVDSHDGGTDHGAEMSKLQQVARNLGLEYLLIFGATVDHASRGTELTIFDLTIVGAFVIPSRQVSAQARASAAVIDLRTSRVVLIAGAESKDSMLASAASAWGHEDQMIQASRENVNAELAGQIVQEARRRKAGLADGAAAIRSPDISAHDQPAAAIAPGPVYGSGNQHKELFIQATQPKGI